jgi:GT2 family glycosyltransferase
MKSFCSESHSEVAVIIASTGRRDVLTETLRSIRDRKFSPACVIVVGANDGDLPEDSAFPSGWQFVLASQKGLTIQRNFGVLCLNQGFKYVVFLDDDVELCDAFFPEVQSVFEQCADVAAFSGCVMLNGGISREEARRQLDAVIMSDDMPPFGELRNGWPGLYGCAMCVRAEVVRNEPFDEALPLYALGEDMEAGFRFRRFGRVGGSGRCVVAHLAVTRGRVSELRVGYSQVANYVHFWKKGIGYTWRDCFLRQLSPSVVANLLYAVVPSADRRGNVDRRGRLLGNFKAIIDLFRGKLHPRRILDL